MLFYQSTDVMPISADASMLPIRCQRLPATGERPDARSMLAGRQRMTNA
jgi:hypothetical protein